jgi:hypothetical protein
VPPYFFLRVCWYADSSILHAKVQQHAPLDGKCGGDSDENLAALGELDGIANQIKEHLAEAAGIADKGIGNIGGCVKGKLESLLLRADGASFQDLLQAVSKLERNQLDVEFSGLNFREIQNVVDDGKQ